MLKSFFTLILIIILPFIAMFFFESYSPFNRIQVYFTEEYVEDTYSSIFALAEETLSSTPKKSWHEIFNTWEQGFGYQVRVIMLDETSFSESVKRRLRQGELVLIDASPVVIMKTLLETEWVMEIALDKQESEDYERSFQGIILLFEDILLSIPRDQWSAEVTLMNTDFAFDVSLGGINQLNLSKVHQEKLLNKELVWVSVDGVVQLYWRLLDTTDVLILGPIDNEGVNFQLLLSIIAFFIVVISIVVLVWLIPIWRSLKYLDKVAVTFGQGALDQRVRTHRTSLTAQLRHSFNLMAARIQKLIKTNQELTNAVAHDLRVPLTKMRFAIEMLETEECSKEEKQYYKKSINKNIDTLDYLLNQILIYSRYARAAETHYFSLNQFDHVVRGEVEEQQFLHEQLYFECHIDAVLINKEIMIDKLALSRALTNLLNNAAKYAKQKIRVQFTVHNGDYVLTVEDDGVGVDASKIENIFEPFKQVTNEEISDKQGHGLGLAIVQQIAKWHDGSTIVTRSHELGGAKFMLKWPVSNCHISPNKA